jgi:hypothetical protein
MLMQLESDVGLPLPASQHFFAQVLRFQWIASMTAHQCSALLYGCIRLRFAFMVMFPIQSSANRAMH